MTAKATKDERKDIPMGLVYWALYPRSTNRRRYLIRTKSLACVKLTLLTLRHP